MNRLLKALTCAALVAFGALAPAYAADSIGHVGTWSVFEERSGSMKTCWTATANDRRVLLNGSLLYVAVTRHSGRQPELSVYADRRLPRSGGMTIRSERAHSACARPDNMPGLTSAMTSLRSTP
ncbi:hypothetical protein [Thioclava sp. ES.031]|uniref:hypothetical protein n=1 Tax=Thioclava sp. ES.031 TaxID=1798203 RepID=UPI001145E61A|nr:hypothetical protein [Thioclava sp. ES.031]